MRQSLNGDRSRRKRIAFTTCTPGLVVADHFVRDGLRAFPWWDSWTTAVALAALGGRTELICRATEPVLAAADVQRTGFARRIGICAAFWFGITLANAVGPAEGVAKAAGASVTPVERAACNRL
jgi:hypothetical protein